MLAVMVCLFALNAGELNVGDWPQFRGPNSDGHVVGPATPMEWSDTKNVVWKVSVPGLGWSSPVIVDGKVFVASCVNAKTGEQYWTERLGNNYSASPLFANNCVLFLSETGLATWVQAGRKFVVLGKNEVPGRTLATPAFSAGAMYLRTDEYLYKIAR